jgi:hypothetical protein
MIKERVYSEIEFKNRVNHIVNYLVGIRDMPFAGYTERHKVLMDVARMIPELRRFLVGMENTQNGGTQQHPKP